jgi:hypothetical protein
MTSVARFIGLDVTGSFTGCYGPVVAGFAGVCGLIVDKRYYHRYPNIRGMTGITLFTGQRMSSGFVRSDTDAVMTTRTGARLPRYRAVVKYDLQPICSVVAVITRLSSWDMSWAFP